MKVVVPLAGPDFELGDGRVKAELEIGGQPLLKHALESRRWWTLGRTTDSDLIFILRDTERSRRFAQDVLRAWFPSAIHVYLQQPTRGAAFTVLAGLAQVAHVTEPICVDLADILYDVLEDPGKVFADSRIGGAGLVFRSSEPCYSYFKTDEAGRVIAVAEKKVISVNASAGTYFFANPEVYLRGVANNLDRRDDVMYRDAFFVSAVMQGLLEAGKEVVLQSVHNIFDIKQLRTST